MSKRVRQHGIAGGGFTLIEALIASVLVGVGVSAMMVATKSGTQVNAGAREITHAINLAQEIREWTLKLPFSDPDTGDQDNSPGPEGSDPQVFVDDLDDLMNVTFSPPRDGNGQPVSDLSGWSQQITLTWRDHDNISQIVADGASEMIYVDVTVSYEGRQILTTGWLVARRQ